MVPPCASTNALAIARPRPERAPPLFWLNISKTRSLSSAAIPGPSSATDISTNGTAVVPTDRVQNMDRAAVRTQACRILQEVGQDLATKTWSISSRGRSGAASICTRPGGTRPLTAARTATSSSRGMRVGSDGEGPRLNAGHVEQVGDETSQPVGLELDHRLDLLARRRGEDIERTHRVRRPPTTAASGDDRRRPAHAPCRNGQGLRSRGRAAHTSTIMSLPRR